jgi:hypothetical protein
MHKVVLKYAGGDKEFVDDGHWDQRDLDVYFYHPLNRGCSKDLQH